MRLAVIFCIIRMKFYSEDQIIMEYLCMRRPLLFMMENRQTEGKYR